MIGLDRRRPAPVDVPVPDSTDPRPISRAPREPGNIGSARVDLAPVRSHRPRRHHHRAAWLRRRRRARPVREGRRGDDEAPRVRGRLQRPPRRALSPGRREDGDRRGVPQPRVLRSGAVGITDCLNFASPEDPITMDRFARAVDGLAAGCDALGVPIVSGNVSPLQRDDGRLGPQADPADADGGGGRSACGGREGHRHAVVQGGGRRRPPPRHGDERGLGGSEYQSLKAASSAGLRRRSTSRPRPGSRSWCSPGRAQLLLERTHDVADGGLAVALAECAAKVGAEITLDGRVTATLFGEGAVAHRDQHETRGRHRERAAEAGVQRPGSGARRPWRSSEGPCRHDRPPSRYGCDRGVLALRVLRRSSAPSPRRAGR